MKKLIVLTAVTVVFITAASPQAWANDKGKKGGSDFKEVASALKVLVNKNHHNARKYAHSRRLRSSRKICYVRGRRKVCRIRRRPCQLSKGYRAWDLYMNGYRR